MMRSGAFLVTVLLSVIATVTYRSAQAQITMATDVIAAPDYDSGASAGAMSNGNFNTPESDGRPGVKFFTLGVQAFRKGDYRHAIDMYKVAASWAYKPAEYNLGVMYFRGQGIPVDRPRGAAWMVLAAERGDPAYVKARDLVVTVLSKPEFARTDELWGALQQTYGDKVALRRAKAQWAWVKTHQTGTRVGGTVGALRVGVLDTGRHGPPPPNAVATSAMDLLHSGSADGSIAYREFQQSDNPYDPVFLKNRTGRVTVEPLQQQKSDAAQPGGNKQGAPQPLPPSSSSQGA